MHIKQDDRYIRKEVDKHVIEEGWKIRKHILLLLLTMVLFSIQIHTVEGLEKTYEWDHAYCGYNIYQVSLTTSDVWQVDSRIDIAFRLTLISKSSPLNYTETVNMRISLNSKRFLLDSGKQRETKRLRNAGDFWEKRVSFYIPAEDMDRGQTLNVSITFEVTYNEIDNIEGKHLQSWYRTTIYDDPMYVSLLRPFLSTLELIISGITTIITIAGMTGYVIYRRRERR